MVRFTGKIRQLLTKIEIEDPLRDPKGCKIEI
jgi:hypothetical protein